jgi:imidazolonepropionase-like amidohydrolase
MIRKTLIAVIAAIAGLAWSAGASDQIPGTPQDHPIVLAGGIVHTVSHGSWPGEVLFDAGRIVEVAARVSRPDGVEVIDVTGRHVYPGFISADTVMGLTEISAVRATNDTAEVGRVTPEVQAEVAVNPDSEIIPVTRETGVLTVLSAPRGGLLAGSSAVLSLDGWTWQEMTVRAPAGMHVNWPRMTQSGGFGSPPQSVLDEGAATAMQGLSDAFEAARIYIAARDAGSEARTDQRWEAMRPVLAGEVPLFIHANTQLQIKTAVAFTREQGVRMVLVGGDDAWRVADLLAEAGVAVVTDVFDTPLRRWEDYDTPYANPAALAAAGVTFAFGSGPSGFSTPMQRSLPFEAAMAVAYGLERERAVRALTLDAAIILGVGDRLGSLDEGKDATLIVVAGDPLEIISAVEMAWIGGRAVDLTSRQTQLYDKYQQRYEQGSE